MPKPLDVKQLEPAIQNPAGAAWEKYKASGTAFSDPAAVVFVKGWNAALAWIPFRIQQFREIEEALQKEIEDLKRGKPPIASDSNST
jgi:hypothetical protein